MRLSRELTNLNINKKTCRYETYIVPNKNDVKY